MENEQTSEITPPPFTRADAMNVLEGGFRDAFNRGYRKGFEDAGGANRYMPFVFVFAILVWPIVMFIVCWFLHVHFNMVPNQ